MGYDWCPFIGSPPSAGARSMGGTDRVSAFAWRSLCQMPLCVVCVGLGLLHEQGAGGTVHLHRDLVERAGRRVMRKADPRNVLGYEPVVLHFAVCRVAVVKMEEVVGQFVAQGFGVG